MFKPKTIRSEHLKKRRRKALIVRAALGVLALALVVGGISWLSRLDALEISGVAAKGAAVVTLDELESVIESETEGNFAGLFSKRNIFLYPKRALEERLIEEYPVFATASVGLKGLRTLEVSVTERTPNGLWCSTEGSDDCYFIDETGFVYAHAPDFKGGAYAKYMGLIEGDPRGRRFLPEEAYSRISVFIRGLDRFGLEPMYVLAKGDGEFEVSLRDGGRIYMDDRGDPESSLASLGSVLEGEKREIEYADLRYGNKIFFKFR